MKRLGLAIAVSLLLVSPVDASWRSEGPFVGAVVDVAIDPTNPDTLYAAAGSGGVWRSDDGGQHWTLPGDDLVNRTVQWIEADPGKSGTVWASVKNLGGPGLWRSQDRGKKWAVVDPQDIGYIIGQPIAFAASNPAIVYAPSTNLHYRSSDGGKKWEGFRVPGQDAYAFAIDPKNPKIIYAGGRGDQQQVSRSEDGGKTWKPVGPGLPVASVKLMAIPREQPSTIYVTFGFSTLFKSDDSGASWTELDLGLGSTDDIFSLDLDPHDPLTLLVGTEDGLRRSTDGGASWNSVGGGLGNWYCKGVAFHPKQKGTVYAGTTGKGFFKSTDGGETFTPMSNGLAAGWVNKIYAPPSASGPLFAQLGVGLFRQDGPGAWTELQAPFAPGKSVEIDGVLFDRQWPKRIYVHQTASLWRSEDAGRSWEAIEIPQPSMRDMMRGKLSGPSFTALAQDAGDPKILYAGGSWMKETGGAAVNKTANGGKKWEPAGAGIVGDVTLLRPAAPGALYAVSKEGVYRTGDGGKSWTLVRPGGEIHDVAADPTKPERVFVATKTGLFRSADNGATWAQVSKGMKEEDVEAVVVAPSGKVFCGSFGGVFVSTNGGDTWTAMNDGLLNPDVRALAIAGGSAPRLFAGVAGGSVHSTDLP